MKMLNAEPWPVDKQTHRIPVTHLERRMALAMVAQLAGKDPEQVYDRREVFEALENRAAGAEWNGTAWDWEKVSIERLEPDNFELVSVVIFTKKNCRVIGDLYAEALRKGLFSGTQSFAVGDLVERLQEVQKSRA